MRVFLAERPRMDISDARRFGEFVFLLGQHVSPFKVNALARLLVDSLIEHEFNPKTDYICLTGQALMVPVLLAATYKEYGTLRLLMFDARISEYVGANFS